MDKNHLILFLENYFGHSYVLLQWVAYLKLWVNLLKQSQYFVMDCIFWLAIFVVICGFDNLDTKINDEPLS